MDYVFNTSSDKTEVPDYNWLLDVNFSDYYEKSGNGNLLLKDFFLQDFANLQKDIAATFLKGLITYTSPFSIVLILLYSIVFGIGLWGNVMVIAVMIRNRHMRTVTNLFFLNLSIGDLLVVIMCMPFTLAPYLYKVGYRTSSQYVWPY